MSALPLLTALALARACGPSVAPQTLLSVAQTESGLDPLSIGVNGRSRASLHPASRNEAVRRARALLAEGLNLDLGLAQINVRNLAGLRLSLLDAFDPCRNLEAGARILAGDYAASRAHASSDQSALDAALSRYNTGDPRRGLSNGYVAQVRRTAASVVPALELSAPSAPAPPPGPVVVLMAASASDRAEARPLDVFSRHSPALVDWAAQATRATFPPSSPQPGDPS